MCGITGVFSYNERGKVYHNYVEKAIEKLFLRGPDARNVYKHNNVSLGHARLSIIDVSTLASQPFTDISGRYSVVFNGEFYNFQECKKILINKGYSFISNSDTEVLLYMFIDEGPFFVNKINGFFSFAVYDNIDEKLFVYRDRLGIKPLYIYSNENAFIFASEMKALMAYEIPKEIDEVSLYTYLQLNYIPMNDSIFKSVKKVPPGHFLIVDKNSIAAENYHSFNDVYKEKSHPVSSYIDAQMHIKELLFNAVSLRMISDVPLGAFLSGGIDSSIVVALASQQTKQLNTFSIGFKDEPLFDETYYANIVAKHFNTNHTVFSLTNDDLLDHLFQVLDYIDEPFADSSALAVYILSMHTKKHVTVALSGDGADEIFAGYNKHQAEFYVNKYASFFRAFGGLSPFLSLLPQSRNASLLNKFRQVNRLIAGAKLDNKQRYWLWASLADEKQAEKLLKFPFCQKTYDVRKANVLEDINNQNHNLNDVLYTDTKLVLPGDMLTKVDLMSMANSLEVRSPFLDYRVVEFAFQQPVSYKIDNNGRKKILRDAFRDVLPSELYSRKKHGFEVPLLKWFRNELKSYIIDVLLEDDFIKAQGIFVPEEVAAIKKQLFSSNPKDVHARIWGLLVFQHWYRKYYI